MPYEIEDTIAAIASAPGHSLRGIIRISGEFAFNAVAQIVDHESAGSIASAESSRTNRQISVRFPIEGCQLPLQGEILLWPTKRSFTGQSSVEIHSIGSPPLLQILLQRLITAGCRPAEPGEFTMRAFLSGRIDLTQAEAVLGLIDARNERQFESSLTQLAGGLAGPLTAIKEKLVLLLAELEAGLDFVEEDIEFVSQEEIAAGLNEAALILNDTIKQIADRNRVDHCTTVVLAGKPNAGKTSLFNALTGSTGIVSEFAGTTRDYLTTDVELEGLSIRLIDTAGLESPDLDNPRGIENQMMAQAEHQIGTADIVLHCVSIDDDLPIGPLPAAADTSMAVVLVRTKADLVEASMGGEEAAVFTSCKDESSLTGLRRKIAELAIELAETADTTTHSALRTGNNLAGALSAVESAKAAAIAGHGEEIVASEIRAALDEIGRIVGIIYTDDILDVVFSRFCIGK